MLSSLAFISHALPVDARVIISTHGTLKRSSRWVCKACCAQSGFISHPLKHCSMRSGVVAAAFEHNMLFRCTKLGVISHPLPGEASVIVNI
jgi:hypothetical protein